MANTTGADPDRPDEAGTRGPGVPAIVVRTMSNDVRERIAERSAALFPGDRAGTVRMNRWECW